MSVRLATMAEPTMPSTRSWLIGAFVKPEASILAVLGLQPCLAGVTIIGVLVCDVGGTAGGCSACELTKSASPGREDAEVDPGKDSMLGSWTSLRSSESFSLLYIVRYLSLLLLEHWLAVVLDWLQFTSDALYRDMIP